ncbi:nucleotidyltransferase family protein [Hahella sp. HN01]|uniref:nucleotidyltransferase family protein n=1 Tax=Hahella sp. HN01 TaxID=2847262 RepID=UPI001C1EAFD9|nr:nucleotidyltransferase family protein [Hahella sp. HN01]MBU6951169.1 nucleotidyltransferase family protein [Hahella sp. HN01]
MEQDTIVLLKKDLLRMRCLAAARSLGLKDWYLAAGFLRNAIWDHLHKLAQATPLNDVDLVYFDSDDTSEERDKEIEAKLRKMVPGVKWEVKNQARMHLHHQHAPYQDTADAISHWVEVPTCVGVRLEHLDKFKFTAKFGLLENWSMQVRPNPDVRYAEDIFVSRVYGKRWHRIWPMLQISALQ